jgi:hypothetical protein
VRSSPVLAATKPSAMISAHWTAKTEYPGAIVRQSPKCDVDNLWITLEIVGDSLWITPQAGLTRLMLIG